MAVGCRGGGSRGGCRHHCRGGSPFLIGRVGYAGISRDVHAFQALAQAMGAWERKSTSLQVLAFFAADPRQSDAAAALAAEGLLPQFVPQAPYRFGCWLR